LVAELAISFTERNLVGIIKLLKDEESKRKAKLADLNAKQAALDAQFVGSYNITDFFRFSDKNRLINYRDEVMSYDAVFSVTMNKNSQTASVTNTTGKRTGVIGRSLVGDTLLGRTGAVIGGLTSGMKRRAITTHQTINDFYIQTFNKSGEQTMAIRLDDAELATATMVKLQNIAELNRK
jgi:hypothetical protein